MCRIAIKQFVFLARSRFSRDFYFQLTGTIVLICTFKILKSDTVSGAMHKCEDVVCGFQGVYMGFLVARAGQIQL